MTGELQRVASLLGVPESGIDFESMSAECSRDLWRIVNADYASFPAADAILPREPDRSRIVASIREMCAAKNASRRAQDELAAAIPAGITVLVPSPTRPNLYWTYFGHGGDVSYGAGGDEECAENAIIVNAPPPRAECLPKLADTNELLDQCDEFRDCVLNCRHQLAEALDQQPDVVNAILALFDMTVGEAISKISTRASGVAESP